MTPGLIVCLCLFWAFVAAADLSFRAAAALRALAPSRPAPTERAPTPTVGEAASPQAAPACEILPLAA